MSRMNKPVVKHYRPRPTADDIVSPDLLLFAPVAFWRNHPLKEIEGFFATIGVKSLNRSKSSRSKTDDKAVQAHQRTGPDFLGFSDIEDAKEFFNNCRGHLQFKEFQLGVAPKLSQNSRVAGSNIPIINRDSNEAKPLHLEFPASGSRIEYGMPFEFFVEIRNTGNLSEFQLDSIRCFPASDKLTFENFPLPMKKTAQGKPIYGSNAVPLKPLGRFSLKATYTPEFYGQVSLNFTAKIFLVRGKDRVGTFSRTGTIVFHVQDPNLKYDLKSNKGVWDEKARKCIPAPPRGIYSKTHLHSDVETNYLIKLPEYPVPDIVQEGIDKKDTYSGLNPWKNRDSFKVKMHNMLFMEEAQQVKDMRRFDVSDTPVQKFLDEYTQQTFFKVAVPDLSERRPSVMVGDTVYLWIPGTEDYEFEGTVEKVLKDHVVLLLNASFEAMTTGTTNFHVRFKFSRILMRRMHQAVDNADISLTWPEHAEGVPKKTYSRQYVLDNLHIQCIHDDDDQILAVQSILNLMQYSSPRPFILRGAFGCGKSMTICEAILQIHKAAQNPRVLVCCESNNAADHITELLARNLTPAQLHRSVAIHREFTPPPVLPFTFRNKHGLFEPPPLDTLQSFSVIVTTYSQAANLYGMGVRPFTHLFLDEAAQTLEPMACIPLQMANDESVIVFAGDEKQLGPNVRSKSCIHHGFSKPIMTRMLELPFYQSRTPDRCVTLRTNYRSHPFLVDLCSKMFYEGMLRSSFNPEWGLDLTRWPRLKNVEKPFLFVAVRGEEAQLEDSPSFYNIQEAQQIATLANELQQKAVFSNGGHARVTSDSFAVITGFNLQRKIVSAELRRRHVQGYPLIGNVDMVQGDEKQAIFVSTVRSRKENTEYDKRHHLGLLFDDKRLTTTFSRAISLLVVVGDPYVLCEDAKWKEIIRFAYDHGCYRGVPFFQDSPAYLDSEGGLDGEQDSDFSVNGESDQMRTSSSSFTSSSSSTPMKTSQHLSPDRALQNEAPPLTPVPTLTSARPASLIPAPAPLESKPLNKNEFPSLNQLMTPSLPVPSQNTTSQNPAPSQKPKGSKPLTIVNPTSHQPIVIQSPELVAAPPSTFSRVPQLAAPPQLQFSTPFQPTVQPLTPAQNQNTLTLAPPQNQHATVPSMHQVPPHVPHTPPVLPQHPFPPFNVANVPQIPQPNPSNPVLNPFLKQPQAAPPAPRVLSLPILKEDNGIPLPHIPPMAAPPGLVFDQFFLFRNEASLHRIWVDVKGSSFNYYLMCLDTRPIIHRYSPNLLQVVIGRGPEDPNSAIMFFQFDEQVRTYAIVETELFVRLTLNLVEQKQ